MSRVLLTQRFKFLVPIRLKQRNLFKLIKDRIKGYRYAKTIEFMPLSYKIYKHKSLLIRKLGDTNLQLQYNKVKNLKLATKAFNGILIKPGETFSFWHLVGSTSSKKGYLPGITLLNGIAKEGIGGGICQLGNLLHWMFLHTGLIIKEKHHHSFDPFPDYGRVIPFGTGASLSYRVCDLKVYNNSDITYQINIEFDNQYIKGYIYADKIPPFSYHIYEKNHRFIRKNDGQVYRQNEIYQKIIDVKTGITKEDKLIMKNDSIVKYKVDDTLISLSNT